jgi:uncharacterized protein YggE
MIKKLILNIVILRIGVTTVNLVADSSLENTNRIIDTIISVLHNYEIKDSNIVTYSTSFIREYENSRDTTTYLGMKSENVLNVKFTDIYKVEELLNVLIGKGMNVLDDYQFKSSVEDSVKRVCAELAFVEARKNAEAIARKSDRKLGKLLNASYEKPDDYRVRPDFQIELSRGSHGSLALKKRGGELAFKQKPDLKYLTIRVPKLTFSNTVYAKFELK